MSKENKAYLALIFGVAAVSTAALFVKLSTAPVGVIAFYRLFFTTIILAVPTIIKHRKDLFLIKKVELLKAFVSGIFLALHFITWFQSLKYTSVASSVVLVTLQPIFAMLGSYLFFQKKLRLKSTIGAVIALSGSIIISWGDFRIGGLAFWGDLLALAGAIFVTGYWLIGESLRKTLSLYLYTSLVYGASSIVLLFYNLILKNQLTNYPTGEWSLFLALAIFPTIFGHTVFNWAIRYLGATTISIAVLGEPIGATILAFIILNEKVNLTQLIGSLIILTGISIYFSANKHQPK